MSNEHAEKLTAAIISLTQELHLHRETVAPLTAQLKASNDSLAEAVEMANKISSDKVSEK